MNRILTSNQLTPFFRNFFTPISFMLWLWQLRTGFIFLINILRTLLSLLANLLQHVDSLKMVHGVFLRMECRRALRASVGRNVFVHAVDVPLQRLRFDGREVTLDALRRIPQDYDIFGVD